MSRFVLNRFALRMFAPALFLLVFFVLFFESTSSAEAQSRSKVCRQLTAQLGALGSSRASGGNSSQYRKYDTAVRKQSTQISKAKRAMRQRGCVGFLKQTRSSCRSLNKSLKKMQSNLNSLKRARAKFAPKAGGNSSKRRRILASLKRNRCDRVTQVAAAKQPEKKSKRRTILEQVFGVGTYDASGNRKQGATEGGDIAISARLGTYRTLCVRKTDGYYFPISFSTIKDRFNDDAEVCQNMCPGTEVGLYYHRMPSEDSEDMIAFGSDRPYAQEPFAFAYRKNHNSNNRCRFSVAGINQSVDTPATGDVEKSEKVIRIGIPNFRKDPTLSPDVYDNEEVRFSVQDKRDYIAAVKANQNEQSEQVVASDRKVRIVGPAFFPVQ